MGDHRLVGATVANLDGTHLGVVTAVAATEADDIYTLTIALAGGGSDVGYLDELAVTSPCRTAPDRPHPHVFWPHRAPEGRC